MKALKPFSPVKNIEVEGTMRVQGRQIVIEFALKDPQGEVEDSLKEGRWKSWERADDLWKSTCFEAFFGVPGEAGYWELNLSPAKARWNLYSFDDYRHPQPPTPSHDLELSMIIATKDSLKCELNAKVPIDHLEASLTAVIRTESGVNYFALTHAGQKPDFHIRKSFLLIP